MKLKTILHEYTIEFIDKPLEINKDLFLMNYSYNDTERITINNNISKYNKMMHLFIAIYNLYCIELSFKAEKATIFLNFIVSNKELILNIMNKKSIDNTSVKLGYNVFEIEKQNEAKYNLNNKGFSLGFCSPAVEKIIIKEDKNIKEENITILHECIHGIFYSFDDEKNVKNEKNIEIITLILMHFINNNKEIIEFFFD